MPCRQFSGSSTGPKFPVPRMPRTAMCSLRAHGVTQARATWGAFGARVYSPSPEFKNLRRQRRAIRRGAIRPGLSAAHLADHGTQPGLERRTRAGRGERSGTRARHPTLLKVHVVLLLQVQHGPARDFALRGLPIEARGFRLFTRHLGSEVLHDDFVGGEIRIRLPKGGMHLLRAARDLLLRLAVPLVL